ncbi:MAG: hypothetical protein ACRDE8_15015 [Ginsengibacter sp.]
MDTQILQNSQNQEEIDKLHSENAELKKNLDREQRLHSMLYKEWKELDEKLAAKEQEIHEPHPKNLFYKYAFYVLIIAAVPASYFIYASRGNEKTSVSQAAVGSTITTDSASVNKSIPAGDTIAAGNSPSKDPAMMENQILAITRDTTRQPGLIQKGRKIVPTDTSKEGIVIALRPRIEVPLNDSTRDLIYWDGWNAFYNNARNHYRRSSERYKIWNKGCIDGRNDSKKTLPEDSSRLHVQR